METKKEIGITKGEWTTNIIDNCKTIFIESPNGCIGTVWDTQENIEANAKLIADAGTTANKYNLLPSELLERYNEAIEVLSESLKVLEEFAEEQEYSVGEVDNDVIELIQKQKQTISKSK